MKRQARPAGAVDKIAEWRRAGELLRAELVATRDRLARELEEAENALCELDGRPVAIEKHLKREPKAPTVVAVAPRPMGKRRRGGGGLIPCGAGWRWKVGVNGGYHRAKATFATQEEARADLTAFLAKQAGGAERESPAPTPRLVDVDTSSPWLPLGHGWGAPDGNGLAKHLACNGRGGLNGNKNCDGCKGEGFARCKLRARAA
jgi:hypothetical protein